MAGRKPYDGPPDGYNDGPPDGYEDGMTTPRSVAVMDSPPDGFNGSPPQQPKITVPQTKPAMELYRDALTYYMAGNRDMAKAKATEAYAKDRGLVEAEKMLSRMARDPLAGTVGPTPAPAVPVITPQTFGQRWGQAVGDVGGAYGDAYAEAGGPALGQLAKGAADATIKAIPFPKVDPRKGEMAYQVARGLKDAILFDGGKLRTVGEAFVAADKGKAIKAISDEPKRFAKGFGAGVGGMVEGAGGAAEWLSKGNIGKSVREYGQKMRGFYAVEDPTFRDAVYSGVGSMATFLIPGIGVSRASSALSFVPRLASWFGVSASSMLEALTEAGGTYVQGLEKWGDEKKASMAATKDFWLNLPTLVFTNKFGLFGDKGSGILKTLRSSGAESIQEGTQSLFGNLALEDPLLRGVFESAGVGAIVGGGTKAAQVLSDLMSAKQIKDSVISQRRIPMLEFGRDVAPLDKKTEPSYDQVVSAGGVDVGPSVQPGSVLPSSVGFGPGTGTVALLPSPVPRLRLPSPADLGFVQAAPQIAQPSPVLPDRPRVVSPPPGFVLDAGPAQAQGSAPVLPAPQQPTVTRPAPVLPAAEQPTLKQRPQAPRGEVDPVELERYPAEDRERIKSLAESLPKSYLEEYNLAREQYSLWQELIGNGIAPNADEMGEYKTLPLYMRKTAANGGTPVDILRQRIMEEDYFSPLRSQVKGGDANDIYAALRDLKAPARPVMDPNYYLSEAQNIRAYEKQYERESMQTDEEPPAFLDALEFEGQFQAGELFEAPKENVGQTFDRLVARARAQGMAVPDAVKYAKRTIASQTRGQAAEQAAPKPVQREMGAPGGVQGFGTGQRGQSEMFQAEGLPETDDLIITHNTTSEKITNALRLGGLPVPSLGITKADSPMEGFGDITLIGDKNIADPKGYAKTKVFGADIYSARYPSISYVQNGDSISKLNNVLKPFREEGERDIYGGEINSAEDLVGDKAFKKYAASRGIDGYYAMKTEAEKLLRETGAEEKIFQGFTYSGRRRYTPHTLENVVRILKKGLRSGENFNYGAGSLRAKFTPQFKSLKQIKSSKELLVSKEKFEGIKDEVNTELLSLSKKLMEYHGKVDSFSGSDIVINTLEDAAKIGIRRALAENMFSDVPVELIQESSDFLSKLRSLPTEYFEAKILRDVGFQEFRGAVVPDGTSQEIIRSLEKRGLDVKIYKKGDAADRKRAIKEFAESSKDIKFQSDVKLMGTAEGQTDALAAFKKIMSANRMTDATFAELVDSIRPDPAAFRKGYGTEYSADKFVIRGATYPVRNHATIKALVRFAKGAHKGTGYHEAMHVIFNNILTAQERQVMMDKFGTEEKAAEGFAQYEAKRTGREKPSRIKAIFDKLLAFLGRLRNYMSGKGWRTAEDVMRSVEQGRTERRRAVGRGQAQYQAEKIESDKAMLPNGGYIPLSRLSKLKRFWREWMTVERGVGPVLDRANEERIGRVMETAFDAPLTGKAITKFFKKNPSESMKEAVFDALTGGRPIESLPEEIVPAVQKMRQDVDALSRLVAQDAPMTDALRDTINRGLGKYLGRHYRLFESKRYRPTEKVIENAKAALRELHPKTLGELTDDQMDGVVNAILSRGDTTFYRGDRPINIPQNHFIKRKDIPPAIRALYGEIKDPTWLYLKTVADMAVVAYNAQFLKTASQIEGMFTEKPTSTHFKQLPDTNKWGAVKGKYTTPEVYDFLNEAIAPEESALMRWMEKWVVNPFKATKTILSIPTHARNMLGNTMFAGLARTSPFNPMNIPHYWDALRIILGRNTTRVEEWKELIRSRVADTQYWGSEMPKLMAKIIEDPVDGPNVIDGLWRAAKLPIEKLGELYNNEDRIFRVAAFLKYKKEGMSTDQAAQEVDKWFTNYSRLPKAVKTARRVALFGPFFSFKANTARILWNAAKESRKSPAAALRLMFALGFIGAMKKLMGELFDIDDDDMEELQKLGPLYKRASSPIYYRDGDGTVKGFDLGYVWPTGDYQRAAKAVATGDLESFADSLDLFEHPALEFINILFRNYNRKFQRDIADPNDPLPRRVADRMAELMRQFYVPASSPIPSIQGLAKKRIEPGILTGYQIKALYDAYHGVQDKFGRTRELPEELRGFLTGIRTWEVHPDDIVAAYIRRKKGELFDAKNTLKGSLRSRRISDVGMDARARLSETDIDPMSEKAEAFLRDIGVVGEEARIVMRMHRDVADYKRRAGKIANDIERANDLLGKINKPK